MVILGYTRLSTNGQDLAGQVAEKAKLARSAGASFGPGKAQQAAWKRVLREAAATRTRSVHSGCVGYGNEPRNDQLAGTEIVFMIERDMCNAVMRGIVVPPGSRAISRANRSRRNLGYIGSDRRQRIVMSTAVRIGKVRSRSR